MSDYYENLIRREWTGIPMQQFPKSDKEDSLEGIMKIIVDTYAEAEEYRKEGRNRLRHSNAIMGLEVNDC